MKIETTEVARTSLLERFRRSFATIQTARSTRHPDNTEIEQGRPECQPRVHRTKKLATGV